MINTAVIMAAGLGTRFGDRTELIPKGFIEVYGIPMIIRSIETLIECGIERIIIGVGYKREVYEALKRQYSQIECCFSPEYATTNSMWTLGLCRDLVGTDDFLLLESDLIYEAKAIRALMEDQHTDIMLIAEETKFQDQYFVEHDGRGNLVNCSVRRNELTVCGELVGIHKLSNSFYCQLCDYYDSVKSEKPKLGYEFVLLYLARNIRPMFVLKVPDLKWYEIDDELDWEYVEKSRILL